MVKRTTVANDTLRHTCPAGNQTEQHVWFGLDLPPTPLPRSAPYGNRKSRFALCPGGWSSVLSIFPARPFINVMGLLGVSVSVSKPFPDGWKGEKIAAWPRIGWIKYDFKWQSSIRIFLRWARGKVATGKWIIRARSTRVAAEGSWKWVKVNNQNSLKTKGQSLQISSHGCQWLDYLGSGRV